MKINLAEIQIFEKNGKASIDKKDTTGFTVRKGLAGVLHRAFGTGVCIVDKTGKEWIVDKDSLRKWIYSHWDTANNSLTTEHIQILLGQAQQSGHARSRVAANVLLSKTKIPESEQAWQLNVALLRDIYENEKDPEVKKQILFAANNYLGKTAPLLPRNTTYLSNNRFQEFFNITKFPTHLYHRMTGFDRGSVVAEINKNLALADKSPLLLTDTIELEPLFPLSFTVLNNTQNEDEWAKILSEKITAHVRNNPKDNKMYMGFLLDLTGSLGPYIQTDKSESKQKTFDAEFAKSRRSMERAIEKAIEQCKKNNPTLSESHLRNLIYTNTTVICRTDLGEHAGIKVLPMFTNLPNEKAVFKKHSALGNFADQTGIFLGAVNYRRFALNAFKTSGDVRYLPQGKKNVVYFPTLGDFSNSALFQRAKTTFTAPNVARTKPYVSVLGGATVKLLDGLFQSIDKEQWDKANLNPSKKELLQITLVKIQNQLATAELHQDDFQRFTQAIESIQAELALLLEIFRPYSSHSDFGDIYSNQLTSIPAGLKPLVQAGLGKTAVNTFAGINRAVMEMNPKAVKCYTPDLYFEEVFFLKNSQSFGHLLENFKETSVDLYASQFNPNINIGQEKTEYAAREIEQDVKNLLAKKTDTKHLTVAIDCTIDFLNSDKNRHLLEVFEKEIHEGKLNFVFFRSGQKLDMLGMDHYFGSPFFIINNRADHWQPFNKLLTDPVHRTDDLSLQWFCLANQHVSDLMDDYRKIIFNNARAILSQVPESLKPQLKNPQQIVRVSTVTDDNMDVSFIDIKVRGFFHQRVAKKIEQAFFDTCVKEGIVAHSKPSFGFYFPNLVRITNGNVENIRINPGMDPKSKAAIVKFIQELEKINTPSTSLTQRLTNQFKQLTLSKGPFTSGQEVLEEFRALRPEQKQQAIRTLGNSERKILLTALQNSKQIRTTDRDKLIKSIQKAVFFEPELTRKVDIKSGLVRLKQKLLRTLDKILYTFGFLTTRRTLKLAQNLLSQDHGQKDKIASKSQIKEMMEELSRTKQCSLATLLESKGFLPIVRSQVFDKTTQIKLKELNLTDIKFSNCTFDWTDFSDIKLENVTFKDCKILNANFFKSTLQNCLFEDCQIKEVMFVASRLENVDFIRSSLVCTSFEDAHCSEVHFNSVAMPGTHFLETTINDSSIHDSLLKNTVFFDSFNQFKIDETSKRSARITRPLTTILLNPGDRGVSAPKVFMNLDQRAHTIPLRISSVPGKAEKEAVNLEVTEALKAVGAHHDGGSSIPQRLLAEIAAHEELYPNSVSLLKKCRHLGTNVNAFFLPGGEDVPPSFYGEAVQPNTGWGDDYRKSLLEIAMVKESIDQGIPLMSVCRGFQITGIYFGYKLNQQVSWAKHSGLQLIELDSEETASFYKDTIKGSIAVVAYHHQGIDTSQGSQGDLVPVVTHRGLIKVLEAKPPGSRPMICIQFHPEFYDTPSSMDDAGALTHALLSIRMSKSNLKFWDVLSDSAESHRIKRMALVQLPKGIGNEERQLKRARAIAQLDAQMQKKSDENIQKLWNEKPVLAAPSSPEEKSKGASH